MALRIFGGIASDHTTIQPSFLETYQRWGKHLLTANVEAITVNENKIF